MKKRNFIIIAGLGIILLVICFAIIILNYFGVGKLEAIGGNTDKYGCLTSAGYSWNESVFACVREWELDSDSRKAANIAILPLSYYVTVTEVIKQDCEGCYIVKLQRNDNRQMEQRIIRGGQISRSTDGGIDNEGDEGKKTYCTVEQRDAQVCTMEYAPVCGWFDSSIQCFKYPCAQTYGNACGACSEAKVAYWTSGECPK